MLLWRSAPSYRCVLMFSFAYIDFDTPEAKISALALSEQPLLGRKLLIKDGTNILNVPKSDISVIFRQAKTLKDDLPPLHLKP